MDKYETSRTENLWEHQTWQSLRNETLGRLDSSSCGTVTCVKRLALGPKVLLPLQLRIKWLIVCLEFTSFLGCKNVPTCYLLTHSFHKHALSSFPVSRGKIKSTWGDTRLSARKNKLSISNSIYDGGVWTVSWLFFASRGFINHYLEKEKQYSC